MGEILALSKPVELEEVETAAGWQKAGFPVPFYHRCPEMRRSKCKRAMRYREQEEPARLECPECGGVCSEALTIILKRRIGRLC